MSSETFLDDIKDGGYTVAGDIVVELPAPASGKNNALDIIRNTKIDGTGTLTLNYEASAVSQSLLNVAENMTLTITGGVKVILNMTAVYSISDEAGAALHAIGNGYDQAKGFIVINEGSSLTVSQAEDAHGMSICIAKITVDNGNFVLDDANGIDAGTTFDVKNGSNISITADDRSAVFNIGGTVKDSEIKATVTDTSKEKAGEIRFAGTSNITDSTVSTNGSIGFASNAAVDAAGTTFEAKTIVVVKSSSSSTPSINGGTVVAEKIENIDGWNSTGANASTLTLGGTTLQGADGKTLTAASGTKITAADGGIIAKGKVDLKSSELTMTGDNKLIASAGSTVTVTDASKVQALPGSNVNGTAGTNGTMTVDTEAKLVAALKADGVTEITAEGAITLNHDATVGDGVTLKIKNSITIGDNITLTNDGKITNTADTSQIIITGTGKFVNNGSLNIILKAGEAGPSNNSTATFGPITGKDAFLGEFTFTKGSLVIDGVIQEGVIKVTRGDVKITGDINGELDIIGSFSGVTFENVTINSGAVVKLKSGGTYTFEGKENYIYGTLIPYEENGNVTMTVVDDSELKAFTGAKISGKVNIVAEEGGKVDLSQAQNPQNVGEDISDDKTYGQLESVTIVDTLTIKNNSTVTVKGSFHVNEGVTLTIESGSKLIINSVAASMIVDGKIIVEDGAVLEVIDADDVKVAGSIESEGTVTIGSTVTVKTGGKILSDNADNSVLTVTKGLTIEAGAELEVRKAFVANAGIANKGTVILNGATISSDVQINMAADSAVVEIRSIVMTADNKKLTITDNGMTLNEKAEAFVTDATKNSIVISINTTENIGFKGIIVSESITSKTVSGTTTYYNKMNISGTVGVVDERTGTPSTLTSDEVPDIAISGPRLAVAETLTLGALVKLNIDGSLSVSGTVTAVADYTDITIGTNGKLSVSGLVQTEKKIDEVAKINAAMYEASVEGETNYFYTTLAAAVASGADTINVYGKITILEDLTIPAGVTIKNSGEIVIGSTEKRDVTVTVKNTATIRNGTVTVDGTLTFENKKDNRTAVVSDVSVIGDVSATYTNVYTALAGAESGDVVTITRNTPVTLDSNVTIKEGVTLDVPNSKKIVLADGVTMTVNGTLKTADAVGAESQFAEKASLKVGEEASAIVVNGTFMSMANVDYTTYKIPGAYYNIVNTVGNYDYVTPLEAAAPVAATVTEGLIKVYGEITSGDVSFIGTDDITVMIVIEADAELSASSITLDNAIIGTVDGVAGYGLFSGTVIVGDSSVKANKALIYISSENGDENMMRVSAKTSESIDGNSSFEIATGTVAFDFFNGVVSVAAGATAVVSDEDTAVAYGKITVNGTLVVAKKQTLNITGDLYVYGTLTVADETDTEPAGIFNVDNLYVGTSLDDVRETGAAASVSGPLEVDEKTVVAAGSTLSETATKSLGKKITAFNVEGSVWITVYATTNVAISYFNNAPVENAYFNGVWNDKDGKSVGTHLVGDEGYAEVYAVVEYDIYVVTLFADQGVDNVYVDGNIMKYGMYLDDAGNYVYGYQIIVSAGNDHKVTYDLKNGYTGEATLKVNGESVSGLSFVAAGNPEAGEDTVDITVQLSGITKSGYVPDSPDNDNSGMTITDYLLIVLVVLIVVMAIIVAMRMMRS